MGSFVGFVLLIAISWFVYNNWLRRSHSPSATVARTLAAAYEDGAPLAPWKLTQADKADAERLATLFAGLGVHAILKESQGLFGPNLELLPAASPSADPLAILSRLWDRDSKSLRTQLMIGGTLEEPHRSTVESWGFSATSPSDFPFTTFHR
jgi:hypothetical protein